VVAMVVVVVGGGGGSDGNRDVRKKVGAVVGPFRSCAGTTTVQVAFTQRSP